MSIPMTRLSFLKIFLGIITFSTLGIAQAQTYLTASLNTPGNAGIMTEACAGPYELVLRRGPDNNTATVIFISGTGTATIGVDYQFPGTAFPAELEAGEEEIVIPITVIGDGSTEGLETIQWEIAFDNGDTSDIVTFETAIVDEYEVTITNVGDTVQWCRDVPFVLLATSNASITWQPSGVFDDSLGTAATVRPFDSGWYYAVVGDDECGAKDSVYFDLAIVGIEEDTVFICKGTSIALNGSIDGLATTFEWAPNDTTITNPTTLTPIVDPSVTTTYTLTSDIGVCKAVDRIVVRVDSLPTDMHIDIAPFKPYYCAGEIVALFSPSYDSLDYPDIHFNWTPNNGTYLSSRELYNTALRLQDTTTYIRFDTNNACTSFDTILINVVPPSVPLSVTDTTLCPGEMFTVEILHTQLSDPEWTPTDGLSCSQCFSPTVTVTGNPGSTLFYELSAMVLDCPVGAVLTIQIPAPFPINVTGETVACPGEEIPLTITNSAELSNITWTISGPGTLSCNSCPDPTVTYNGTGAVLVTVTAETTNEMFCGATGGITITQGNTEQFTGPTHFACVGESVEIDLNRPEVSDLTWSVLSGDATLSCTNCDHPVVTLNANQSATLRFMGETTNPNFCNVSGTLVVSPYPAESTSFTIDPDPNGNPPAVIGQGDPVTVTLNVQPVPSTITWIVNGVNLPQTGTSVMFNANEEVNSISATYINSNGCEQTDTIQILTVPPSFKIPNAFTPNGDMLNDKFRIIVTGAIEIQEFHIFNRWGQMVYEAPSDDTEGWDGRFKDEPAASDTYVYTAKLRYPDGRVEIAKGDLTLLR